jgi:hypothetical protein
LKFIFVVLIKNFFLIIKRELKAVIESRLLMDDEEGDN